jgi:hypothetical protein
MPREQREYTNFNLAIPKEAIIGNNCGKPTDDVCGGENNVQPEPYR